MTSGSPRIKGKALGLMLGSPPVNHWCDMTAVEITNEESDSDVTTFCDAAEGGGRDFFLNMTSVQSTAADSFWRMAWEKTGEVVAFTYAPHGNEIATADKPHFTGTVKIGPKPNIGGEAGTNTTFVSELVWRCEDEDGNPVTPVLDEGPPPGP